MPQRRQQSLRVGPAHQQCGLGQVRRLEDHVLFGRVRCLGCSTDASPAIPTWSSRIPCSIADSPSQHVERAVHLHGNPLADDDDRPIVARGKVASRDQRNLQQVEKAGSTCITVMARDPESEPYPD